MEKPEKTMGIKIVAWCVIAGNVLLVLLQVVLPFVGLTAILQRFTSLMATVAAFPLDFYRSYFPDEWIAQLGWIFTMGACAFGVLRHHYYSRVVFIVLNIIHVVFLAYIVIAKWGQYRFLDHFFKLYFNLVASGAYVGYITIPEVRAQFKIDPDSPLVKGWIRLTRLKTPAPHDALGFYNLGVAYNRLGRFADAIDAFKKAIHIDAKNADFHYRLGLAYLDQKKYGQAISAFKEVVRLNPQHTEAKWNLGIVYKREGCHQEATDAFEQICREGPQNADIYKNLGECYGATARFEAAVAAFQKAVDLNSQDADAYFQMGEIYLDRLEKFKEAQEALKTSLRLNPHNPQASFLLGMACLKLSRYKEAIRTFKDVIQVDEGHAKAHYQLGFSYAMIEDFDSVQRQCRVLNELDPDLADTLAMLIK